TPDEQVVLATDGLGTQTPLRHVVVDAQLALAGIRLEILPLRPRIRDGLADRTLRQNLAALLLQPLAERVQQRHGVSLPDRAARLRGEFLAGSLDAVELPNPSQGLIRRQRGRGPSLVEFATRMGPARHPNHVWPGTESVVPGECIGLEVTRE